MKKQKKERAWKKGKGRTKRVSVIVAFLNPSQKLYHTTGSDGRLFLAGR